MVKNLRRAYSYLDNKEKKLFLFSIFLTFISAVFESLSIGIIIPLSSIVLGEPNEFIMSLNIDNWELIIVLLFFFSIFSGLFIRIFSMKLLNSFSWNLTTKFSRKLLKDVIDKPIEEIENFDSNDIKSAVAHKIYTLMLGFIVPAVRTFAAATFAIIILVALFFIDPWVLLFVSLFVAVPYSLVYFFISTRTALLGIKIADAETTMLRNLNELFFDIRGARSRSQLDSFLELHVSNEFILRSSQLKSAYLREVPRFIIEAGILSFIATAIYLSTVFSSITISVPILAAYALGLQRALPHFQNIFSNLNAISTNKKSVDSVFDKFEVGTSKNKEAYYEGEPNIRLEDINFSINSNKIFNNFNLEIKNSTFNFLIGPSGSGKSTLVDIISGYKNIQKGNSTVFVKDIKKAVSYMSQNTFIYSCSLQGNIVGDLIDIDEERYQRVLDICNLKSLDKELLSNNQNTIGDGDRLISGGQMQRICIARAIYARSSIYILDEPFSALDQKTAHDICKNLIDFLNDSIVICILHNQKIMESFNDIPRIDLSHNTHQND